MKLNSHFPNWNENGITLIELMMALMIGSVVMVTAMGIMLNASGTSSTFVQSLDAEIDELAAINALQLVFGQAYELKSAGNSDLNTFVSSNGTGRVRTYDSDPEFNLSPATRTLAVFWRDRQNSSLTSPSALISDLKATGVYFQKPTPTTWGVLYINLGTSPNLAPSRQDLMFEGLTRFQILSVSTYDDPDSTPPMPVTSLEVALTFRRFIGDVDISKRQYCPKASIAMCPGIGAFRDVTKTYKLLTKNNTLAFSPSNSARGARIYDLIHFFSLGRTGALR